MASFALLLILSADPVPGEYESNTYLVVITKCPGGYATQWYQWEAIAGLKYLTYIGFMEKCGGAWMESCTSNVGSGNFQVHRQRWLFFQGHASYNGWWLAQTK